MDKKTEIQLLFLAWIMAKDYMKNNPLGTITGGENETE